MFWTLLLLALGLFVLWCAVNSRERTEVLEEELLASHGVVWQRSDPFGYLEASELAAARLTGRAHMIPPARGTTYSVSRQG